MDSLMRAAHYAAKVDHGADPSIEVCEDEICLYV